MSKQRKGKRHRAAINGPKTKKRMEIEMKKNKTLITLAALALILFAGSFVVAEEKADEGGVPGMTPEMMAKWAEMASPNEHHKALEGMIGTWSASTRWWPAPGAEPMASTGTCTNSWVLGGRWVRTDYTGEMMGRPFEGIGYMGYDNFKKKYISTWMDNMSTAVLIAEGEMKDGVCTLTAEFDDVITGEKKSMREVFKVIDEDRHVMEMYGPAPDGTEFKMMVIEYTRTS